MVSFPAERPKQTGPRKLKVFISYSRRDAAFVDRLQIALQEEGIEAAVDRAEIAKGEEWWKRIEQLITEADTLVFVLSPDAIRSQVCQDEVDYAESLNKRLIPVVSRDLDGPAPDALARLNYIFFTGVANAEFDTAAADLVRALEIDISWIREHTRLGTLAGRWSALRQPDELLLRGRELTAAETWLTTRPPRAPDPTDGHRALITESRRAATRRQRTAVTLSFAGIAAAVALAGFAFWQMGVAIENERRAEERSALLAAGTATELSAGGATDEALALLLQAGQVFEGRQAPDKLLIALDQAIEAAEKRTSYRYASGSAAIYLQDAYFVFDPETERVTRIAAGGSVAVVGRHKRAVAGAELLPDGSGLMIVGADLSVSQLDFASQTSRPVSRIAWPDSPPSPLTSGGRIEIGDDGLILFQSETDSSGTITVVVHHWPSNKTVTKSFEGYHNRFHPISGADPSGRRFIGESRLGEVFAIDAAFGSIVRAEAEDSRWRPRFACQRRPGSNTEANAAGMADDLMGKLKLPYEKRICVRVAKGQALYRDTSITSAGQDISYGYLQTGQSELDILPHLVKLMESNNTPGLHANSDLSAVDFLPGGTLLLASHNRDIIVFDGERIIQTIPIPVPSDNSAFLSKDEIAVVERIGGATQITVHRIADESEDSPDTAESSEEEAEVDDEPLHFGTCSGYTGIPTTRSATLPDGARLTVVTGSATGHSDENHIVIAAGPEETTFPLPERDRGCVSFSSDWTQMLVVMDRGVRAYDLDVMRRLGRLDDALIGEIEIGQLSSAAFFAGPENDVVTAHWTGEIVRWRIARDGAPASRQVIYRGTKPIYHAEPDTSASRLLILEDLGGGYVRGFLYSVSAQQEWWDLGHEYKWLRLTFLSSDRLEFGSSGQLMIDEIPDLATLTAKARAAWSVFCQVDDLSKIATSPCWPSQLRY